MTGPLAGLRVVELASIGPGPHAGMVLADLGADVVRIERPTVKLPVPDPPIVSHRGRRRIVVDLKTADGKSTVLAFAKQADVLIEGMRPGVAERLGIGPEVCLAANPRLVYGRITGWGQEGPLAQAAGHDINFIGLTGVLNALGRHGQTPPPPLNLVGDYGGGSMLLLVGVLAALWERTHSQRGQVVDAAMVDGAALLAQMIWGLRAQDEWSDERGTNLLDGGAPYYDTYECSDGKFVAVGSLEPQFFEHLITGLGISSAWLTNQGTRESWPALRQAIAERFRSRTRDEWTAQFNGTDACVTPVLSFEEAAWNEHLARRGTIIQQDGFPMAAPAPRFSRTAANAAIDATDLVVGAEALEAWGDAVAAHDASTATDSRGVR